MSRGKHQGSTKDQAAAATSQGFAEELLRLCERAYEIEVTKKEEMEKKAQYYLAIITGVLGILAFKGDVFNLGDHANVAIILARRGWPVAAALFLLFISIIISLYFVVMVLTPRKYDRPYPNNLLTFLHRASSSFKSEADLIRNRAEEFAWAAEMNIEVNVIKSRWLWFLSRSVFANLTLLTVLLVVSAL